MIVRDGNLEGKRPLYDQRKEPTAEPDIVMMSAVNQNTVVADVKYKGRPDRADINQVVTYAAVYRSKRVVMIHQSDPGSSGHYDIGSIGDLELFGYGIDLAAPDYGSEETKMASYLLGLVA